MRIFHLITFASLFIFSFSSCKKNTEEEGIECKGYCFMLKGQLLDTPANNKISGVELKFYYDQLSFFNLFSAKYLGSVITDANGEYIFDFDATNFRDPDYVFVMKYSKPGYFYQPSDYNDLSLFHLVDSNINVPYVQNFTLYKSATLKVHIKVSTFTDFNYLEFRHSYKTSSLYFSHNYPGHHPFEVTFTEMTAGDVNTYIKCETDHVVQVNDSIIIPAGTEQLYEINL